MTPPLLLTSTSDPDATVEAVRSSSSSVCVVLPCEWNSQQRSRTLTAIAQAQSADHLHAGDLVVFGSGSTGHPRGIIRTWKSWHASLSPLTELTAASRTDVIAVTGSVSSTMNLYARVHAADIGATVVNSWSDSVTLTHIVAPAVAGVLDRVAEGHLPNLRMIITAGDRVEDALHYRAHDLGLTIGEYYGAAELSFVGWRTGPNAFSDFPGVTTQIRDGDLWVSSDYVARAPLSDPGSWRQDAAWHTVGDRVEACDSGGWFIRGRGNTAVTTAGHTVLVEEVEADLRTLPGVTDCGVAGTHHPSLGSILVAVVVTDLEVSQLKEAVKFWPAPVKPRRWIRVGQLPRTSGGKLDRVAMRHIVEESG